MQEFLTLGHAADQTEFNIALEQQGDAHLSDLSYCVITACPLSCAFVSVFFFFFSVFFFFPVFFKFLYNRGEVVLEGAGEGKQYFLQTF